MLLREKTKCKIYFLYKPISTLLNTCCEKLDQEFSRCWSILAKNRIISLKKCTFMIGFFFILNWVFYIQYCKRIPRRAEKIKCSRGAGRYGGGTARRGAAWTFNFFKKTVPGFTCWLYSTVQYCTVPYSTVQYCTILYSTVQYRKRLYSTVQNWTVLYTTVEYCTVLYSTVQYCTILYSTVQYCTVLYSTGQYCTVLLQQYCCNSTVATVPVSYTHLTLPTTPYV